MTMIPSTSTTAPPLSTSTLLPTRTVLPPWPWIDAVDADEDEDVDVVVVVDVHVDVVVDVPA